MWYSSTVSSTHNIKLIMQYLKKYNTAILFKIEQQTMTMITGVFIFGHQVITHYSCIHPLP